MASKNLGAVIQRAISDGAFRRQLQSDPAAALRGFNLTPDEIAAVRSGDSGRLMSLGVDQRMSKAFSISGSTSQASVQATGSDISGASSMSSSLTSDGMSGARESLATDSSTGARSAISDGQTGGQFDGARATIADGQSGGTQSVISTGQQDSYRSVNDPDNTGGTRETVSDPTTGGTRDAISTGQQDSYRAVNDPDNTGATREAVSTGQQDSYRAVNDPDNTGATREAISTGQQDSYRPVHDPDDAPLSSHMQDAHTGLTGGDAQFDPGFVETHSAFVPSDSADVQRELLDGQHSGTGDALGHTGDTGDEHSWG